MTLEDNTASPQAKAYARSDLVVPMTVREAKSLDDLRQKIQRNIDTTSDRLNRMIHFFLDGFVPLLLYPIAIWVYAGFREPETPR
jgi:hypothetical protein